MVHPYDRTCYCLACAYTAQKEMREEMRSTKTRTIEVQKVENRATMPVFINLFHRHFQKAMPAIKSDRQATLNAPLDLLDMIIPEDLLANMESIEVVYRKD